MLSMCVFVRVLASVILINFPIRLVALCYRFVVCICFLGRDGDWQGLKSNINRPNCGLNI